MDWVNFIKERQQNLAMDDPLRAEHSFQRYSLQLAESTAVLLDETGIFPWAG